MDVSIIIVNYNTLQMTSECINSIFDFTKQVKFEVIVVDNSSSDGSLEYFKKDKRIKYIYSEQNLGFGRANNIGYKNSIGRYVLLLNSDTVLINDAISEFVIAADNEINSSVGCWGTMLLDRNMLPTHSYAAFPTLLSDLKKDLWLIPLNKLGFRNDDFRQGLTYTDNYVDYIIGADLLIKKEVIEQFGLFDERFFMYYEDVELQKRYSKYGIKSRMLTSPKVVHLEGGSARKKGKKLDGSITKLKSKIIYFSTYYSRWEVILYKLALVIGRIPFFLFSNYTYREKKKYLSTLINTK